MAYTSEEAGRTAAETAEAPNQSPAKEADMAFSDRSTPPAFQFYASDFLGSSKVGRMSSAEIGIYTLLLCHAWTAQGLPVALPEIARLARVSRRRLELLWPGVLSECFVEAKGIN